MLDAIFYQFLYHWCYHFCIFLCCNFKSDRFLYRIHSTVDKQGLAWVHVIFIERYLLCVMLDCEVYSSTPVVVSWNICFGLVLWRLHLWFLNVIWPMFKLFMLESRSVMNLEHSTYWNRIGKACAYGNLYLDIFTFMKNRLLKIWL